MKNMKLIMENFKKNMQNETWNWGGSKEDSEAFVQKQLAKHRQSKKDTSTAMMTAIEAVKKEVLDMYDNEYSNIQDIVDDEATDLSIGELKIMCNRAFGDAYAQITGKPGIEASEEDMLMMFDALDVLEDDEQDGIMPSDKDDPPGYMPGEGGNY
tara:strand:+ start:1275 stop:1739 length:465 start_codon:yes stop_codon:yes gene_type:complete